MPQVGCWGRGRQSPRTLLKGPSSSLPLSAGDGGGYAARREASAPFLHSATPQNPSQQLPRGWAEGQGSVLASPPSGGTEGTQWGCAQPWEANCGAEEELHGGKGWWGAAWHTASRRVWLHHHRPEVRTGDRIGGMWRVCISPSQAVMAPYAWVNLFRSLLGSGLWWGQLPILSPFTALLPPQSFLLSAHTKARARCHRTGGWDRLNQVCVHNCLYACSCARGRGVRSPPSLHIHMLLAPAHPDTAPSQHSSCCTCGTP